jgi:hypothetical protein
MLHQLILGKGNANEAFLASELLHPSVEAVMKRFKVPVFVLVVLAALVLPLAGCSLLGINFINNSSHTVEVTPLSQDWEFFFLDPGKSHTISPKEGYASFLYSPASTVACDSSQGGKVIFTDR